MSRFFRYVEEGSAFHVDLSHVVAIQDLRDETRIHLTNGKSYSIKDEAKRAELREQLGIEPTSDDQRVKQEKGFD